MNNKKKVVLVQIISGAQVQTYEIDKSEFLLGRGDTSEIRINENGISREHVRIQFVDGLIQIKDLNSSNGTFLEGSKLQPNTYYPVFENHIITFGHAQLKLKLKILELTPEVENVAEEVEKMIVEEPVVVDLSAFPKTDEDFKLNFKNVGLNMPQYKNANEHAKEIIDGAEYIKRSIIKSAEVYKTKMINETKLQTKKATDDAYEAYQAHVDRLLDDTRKQLQYLKVETEILLDDKRLQASEEIQNLWKEHREIIAQDKAKQLETVEKENIVKLELSMEKLKGDMFTERHRLITDAENEILKKRRTFQVEFENEKSEHLARLKLYTEELNKIQGLIADCDRDYKANKIAHDDSALELSKISSQLKQEKENLEFATKTFQNTLERHRQIESELAQFNQTKTNWELEKQKAEKDCEKLGHLFAELSEKKQHIDEEIKTLSDTLSNAKIKLKDEVETEYRHLKEIEAKKFSDYKANELKELQKIRDAHTNTIKKFSVDLSQEIATKIEMLAKKSGQSNFDFEKNFELINSVIQIKSAMNTGSESIHAEQLEGWKNRKRKESFTLLSTGFAIAIAVAFIGNLAYKKLSTDPVKERQIAMAKEQKERDTENQFIAVKSNKYFDDYVDATIYTENFAETYLDDKIQQEWVTQATKYFLKQWKVDEEKVIQVISNSKAFVQLVKEAEPTLKKSRLNADIAKLKAQEEENTQNQAKILGTNVKYEAYKKLEKDFFKQKINRR